jgi:hypothetical protein
MSETRKLAAILVTDIVGYSRLAGADEERTLARIRGLRSDLVEHVVEESDGDLMGDGVNIAARLESVAKPGAICLSEQAYWQVKGRLDLKVTDLGATQLKNIAEPIRIYSLEVGQQPQAAPAPSTASTLPVDHQAAIERIEAKRGFGRHVRVYVGVNFLLIAIWAITSRGYFWPIWPLLGWGVGLGMNYWSVFLRKPISDDEIRRELEKGR